GGGAGGGGGGGGGGAGRATAASAEMGRAFFMSFLLLLGMRRMARRETPADPPGDLHMRLAGRDREATVLELCCDACGAGWIEVAELVLERRFQRSSLSGQLDGG